MNDYYAKKQCDPGCPLCNALRMLDDKWAMTILHHLDEPRCFGELKQEVAGISGKMLIQTLRNLENNKLVSRKSYDEVPSRVEYSLIKKVFAPLTSCRFLKILYRKYLH